MPMRNLFLIFLCGCTLKLPYSPQEQCAEYGMSLERLHLHSDRWTKNFNNQFVETRWTPAKSSLNERADEISAICIKTLSEKEECERKAYEIALIQKGQWNNQLAMRRLGNTFGLIAFVIPGLLMMAADYEEAQVLSITIETGLMRNLKSCSQESSQKSDKKI